MTQHSFDPIPLPAGMVDILDPDRLDAVALEVVLAQEPDVRSQLLDVLARGGVAVVQGFDEDGFSLFGIDEPGVGVHVLGRLHWTNLHPNSPAVLLSPRGE